ncbi:MAG TPA: hypothetical protein VHN20_03280 [Beijerinckiaceae bacterium]|nr:hypothetical protein [Beijerinckiaceae bacterium]
MLRKVVLASIAAAGLGLALAGSVSAAKAQSWQGETYGAGAYRSGRHDGGWDRGWHRRHHQRHYGQPPWRRWHWSRHVPPGHYYGRPVAPRPYW